MVIKITNKELLLLQMYSEYKKKRTIIITVVLVVILIVAFCLTAYYVISSQTVQLKQKTITVEYGNEYTPNITDFINETDVSDVVAFNYNMPNEDNKKYADVGKYDIQIDIAKPIVLFGKEIYKSKISKLVTVVVEDTTPPVFDEKCPSNIEIVTTTDNNKPDLSKYFTATDISGECDIKVTDDGVDYKTANEYDIKATATDKNGNQTTQNCKLVIVEPLLTVDNTNIVLEEGQSYSINASVNTKGSIKYTSENTSICTVDADGVIKAISNGSCSVDVTYYDKTVKCNVTVNEKKITAKSTPTEQTTKATKKQNTSKKPGNKDNYPPKDFLFKDGYTMDNVSDAAYAYLKASGKPGSCVPLKDSEGIYIGMRVVFN